jgi:D-3-phosphoglycerate dehydrogenase
MSAAAKCALPIVVASRSLSANSRLREEVLSRFSNVRFNDAGVSLSGQALENFLQGAHGAIIALEKITDALLKRLPQLKVISKYGVGLDNLDLEAMRRCGVQLGWTGGVNSRAVTELTLALALGLSRQVFASSRKLAAGEWKTEGGLSISGKTVGVIGCGYVGKDVARMFHALGCQLLIHDILPMPEVCQELGASQVELEKLLSEADVVTLHVPFQESTRLMVSRERLAQMKSSAILINTSRGGIVDEQALLECLSAGKIRGAAMDVFAVEPAPESPLLKLPNFVGTPHIGGASAEAIHLMGMAAVENLARLMAESR